MFFSLVRIFKYCSSSTVTVYYISHHQIILRFCFVWMVMIAVGGAALFAVVSSLLAASDPSSLLGYYGLACIDNVNGRTRRRRRKTQQTNADTRLLLNDLISNGLTLT